MDSLDQQRELYGEPVRDLVRRVADALGLSQGGVAALVGLSPAMLSQLVSGQRVKIGNPQVLARLRAALELADQAPGLTREQLAGRKQEIAASRETLTRTVSAAVPPQGSELVRHLLRAVASGRELERAAAALVDVAPGVAEVVRVYGRGSARDAAEHLASVSHLLERRP